MKKNRTKRLAYMALLVALNALCSWIFLPFAVPFTLQTFSVFFTLFFLGSGYGTATIALYLILGLAGVPVFSGFQGGLSAFAGPTGGFLIGFLFSGAVCFLSEKIPSKKDLSLPYAFVGLFFCYLFGTLWFAFIYEKGTQSSFLTIFLTCVAPFILPDVVKIFLARKLAVKLKTILFK